jgi:hypothetical protein
MTLDIKGTLGGSLAATLGSHIGAAIASKNIKSKNDKDKISAASHYGGYASGLGLGMLNASRVKEHGETGTSEFIHGAGAGALLGSIAAGLIAKHIITKKRKQEKTHVRKDN